MDSNLLTGIPEGSFGSLASLRMPALGRSKIEAVAAGSFDSNNQLRAWRLDSNRLTGIEGLFSKVSQLMGLNVSEDNIQAFDCSLVPLTKLVKADLSVNDLSSLTKSSLRLS